MVNTITVPCPHPGCDTPLILAAHTVLGSSMPGGREVEVHLVVDKAALDRAVATHEKARMH